MNLEDGGLDTPNCLMTNLSIEYSVALFIRGWDKVVGSVTRESIASFVGDRAPFSSSFGQSFDSASYDPLGTIR